ncbi:uncharacterized protein LOC113232490 isoform X2 [Hyposmocoma kahamanoa]|nr:uncharacterized protein LOC113232490 isoform X2 [Hyposmocoma kahamanoa]
MQYIKMFQQKEDLGKSQFQEDEEDQDEENQSLGVAGSGDNQSVAGSIKNHSVSGSATSSRSKIIFEEDLEENNSVLDDTLRQTMEKGVDDYDSDIEDIRPKKKQKIEKFKHDINVVTKGVLLAILYVALNLDQSEIQLSHLCRFIREGRLSIMDCKKFVPKEINISSTTHWKSFIKCTKEYTPNLIRATAMTLFKRLDLGKPLVPDIRKIVHNFIKELCLPNDFEGLVFSLIEGIPCNFAEIKMKGKKATLETVRIPDYETVIMSYIVVALKMCFGLDDLYEIELSEAIDKVNQEKDYQKSHKLGRYSNETDRLFSFREWCNFLQFRKSMLCKFYLPMAQQHNLEVDDHIFMEHLPERPKRKVDLSDEITLDILNKIPLEDSGSVIPFSEFPPTLTPLSSYIEIILDYYQDPELKLLLSEDFTQYSLKYTCLELKLPYEKKMLKGVKDDNKQVIVEVKSELVSRQADTTMVYVRNCENKNWLKTKPPTIDHVTKVRADEDDDKNSDHGYDSNTENVDGSEKSDETERERILEYVKEEDLEINIFDDQFDDMETKVFNELDAESRLYEESHREFQNSTINIPDLQNDKNTIHDSKSDIHDNVSEVGTFTSYEFDPATFDKDKTIEELILSACKKYKIPVPPEYSNKKPRKRKTPLINTETGCSESKKRKTEGAKRGETRKEIERILTAYYSNMERNVLGELAEHVKIVIKDLDTQEFDEPAVNDDDRDTLVLRDLSSEQNLNDDSLRKEVDSQSEAATNKDNTNDPSENSVLETNIENTLTSEDMPPKSDPKFDEKTHDIKQLYIKFTEEFDFDDYLDDGDPEITEIITKTIENYASTRCKETSLSDEDDIKETADCLKENKTKKRKKETERKRWETFVKYPHKIKEFYYWRRNCEWMKRTLNIQQKFDLEVKESLPKSFSFVIQECASIANCSVYMLYKCMQTLESLL